MKEYSASASIEASPETVWAILTNASGYPEWNPGVVRIEGTIAPDEKVTVYTTLSPDRAFPVTVSEFVPNERMTWTGGMPLGLFKGKRIFTLTLQEDGTTEFVTRETFSGPLLAVMGRSIPDLTESFEQFASGLKSAAEKAE